MRKSRAVLLLALLLLLQPASAGAVRRSLVRFANLQQRVEFTYLYNGRETEFGDEDSSSSRHQFEELYGLDLDYAVYDPAILKGRLSVEGVLNQNDYSSSDHATSEEKEYLRYSVIGTLFEQSPYKIDFFRREERNTVDTSFTGTYYQDLESNGIRINGKHHILPFYLDYLWTDLATDGLTRNFERRDEFYSAGFFHHSGGSTTSLDYQGRKSEEDIQGVTETNTLEARGIDLHNTLNWGERHRRSLTTLLAQSWENGTTFGIERENERFNWAERLQWQFGRALHGGLGYSRMDVDTGFDKRRSHNGNLFLRHSFVQSLTTEVSADAQKETLSYGSEEMASGSLNLSYLKQLPARSSMLLQVFERYGYVDRDHDTELIVTTNEPHTAALTGLLLDQRDVVAASIEVRNADPAVRLLPYRVGFDYEIIQTGALTFLVFPSGSEIPEGSNLLVSYSFSSDSSGAYRQKNHRIASSFMLNDNACRIYGSWEETGEELISGNKEFGRGIMRKQLLLGFESIQLARAIGFEFERMHSEIDKRYAYKGFYRRSWPYRKGVLSVSVADSYFILKEDPLEGQGARQREQNTANLDASFRTRIFNLGNLLLNSHFYNSRGDLLRRDDVGIGLEYLIDYGKFALHLRGKMTWRTNEDETSREDFLYLKLTRFF